MCAFVPLLISGRTPPLPGPEYKPAYKSAHSLQARQNTVSHRSEPQAAVSSEVDEAIQERVEILCKKAHDIHEETAKTVLKKFHEARKRKLEKLKKEIQTLQEEQDKMARIIQKIS